MSLIDKFDKINLSYNDFISKEDDFYCKTFHEAYVKALGDFKKLKNIWFDLECSQDEILFPVNKKYTSAKVFIRGSGELSVSDIEKHTQCLHRKLIDLIVVYFNNTYNVTISEQDVATLLLPSEPERSVRYNKDEWKAYHSALSNLVLDYKEIINTFILKLEGRNFSERAFFELTDKCHKVAWNTYNKKPCYEIKKDVICLQHGCRYSDWLNKGDGDFELNDITKTILRGIAHFETNDFNAIPQGFSEFLSYYKTKEQSRELSSCTKFKQIKLFKNSRVDLKFQNAKLASQFAEIYLGTVCS